MFAYSIWSDQVIGCCLLTIAILLLVSCLVGIVRLLNSLLAGQVAIWVRQIVDKQLPRPFGWLTNYLVMLFGCFVVMIVSDIHLHITQLQLQ
jgi:sodium-dependent phosphate cotransporter